MLIGAAIALCFWASLKDDVTGWQNFVRFVSAVVGAFLVAQPNCRCDLFFAAVS